MGSVHRMRAAAFYAVCLVAAVMAGTRLGSVYERRRLASEPRSALAASQSFLAKSIVGIKAGRVFPNIPVWTPDGARGVHILELLPRGGVIVLIAPECFTCIQAVEAVHAAVHSQGIHPQPVVIVTSTQNKRGDLTAFMRDNAIDIPLYCDAEEALIRQFSVVVNPAYFRVDSAGTVLEFGPVGLSAEQYVTILSGP